MTARAELPTRLLTAVLLTLAAIVGVVAGYSPPVAIGLTLGLVFLAIAMTNLTVGIALFALLTFLESILPTQGAAGTFSVPKLLGLVLMISWLGLVTAGEREYRERIFSHPAFLLVLFTLLRLGAGKRGVVRGRRRRAAVADALGAQRLAVLDRVRRRAHA